METFVTILFCLLLEGFFSGSEMAVISMSRTHLQHLVRKGSRRAAVLHRMLEKPEWLLGTTLLGTNLAVVTLSAVTTFFVISHWGKEKEYLALLVSAPLVLIFGEFLPKAIFQRFANSLALHLVFPLRWISYLFSPLVAFLALVSKGVLALFGLSQNQRSFLMTRDELQITFQSSEKRTGIKAIEQRMINRVFRFSTRKAREIMIPLVDLVSVRDDYSLADVAATMKLSGHSRLPVYSFRVDHIVGWINHHDLLRNPDKEKKVQSLLRKSRFVPANISLGRLFLSMQWFGDSLVMVVDEYGGVVGMVTMEDVLEEVVGDIDDEYDFRSTMVRKVDSHTWLANARISVEKVNEILPISLPSGDYETLGGFLLSQLQRIPTSGDRCIFKKITFIIQKTDERSIQEVEIRV